MNRPGGADPPGGPAPSPAPGPGTAAAFPAGPSGRHRRRDFPGWRMVWALAGTEIVGYGVLYYAFAVYLAPMRAALHASTGQVALALSVSLAVAGAAAPAVGRWLDAHGARALMSAGSLLGATSVAGWSQARSLPQLYLAFAGIGLAGAAVLYEPAFAVINTWFDRDRTPALLSLTVIAGFSSTLTLPLAQALLQTLGWRHALLVLAGLLALCAVPHAVLLRRRPADLGLQPDGAPTTTRPDHPTAPTTPTAGAAGRRPPGSSGETRPGWSPAAVRWLAVANTAQTVAATVVSTYLVGYLTSTGRSGTAAAAAAGALGVAQVAGRITLTVLARTATLGRRAAQLIAGQALGVLGLLTLPRPADIIVFIALFGGGFGVMSITRAALLGSYVTPAVFARTAGRQALLANTGRVLAPVTAGAVIADAGYRPTLIAVASCTLLAAAALLAAEHAAQPRPGGLTG